MPDNAQLSPAAPVEAATVDKTIIGTEFGERWRLVG